MEQSGGNVQCRPGALSGTLLDRLFDGFEDAGTVDNHAVAKRKILRQAEKRNTRRALVGTDEERGGRRLVWPGFSFGFGNTRMRGKLLCAKKGNGQFVARQLARLEISEQQRTQVKIFNMGYILGRIANPQAAGHPVQVVQDQPG